MTNYVKVQDRSNLVRDPNTMAILNTSREDYEAHIRKMRAADMTKLQIEQNAREINNIKDELNEIKTLLLQLVRSK